MILSGDELRGIALTVYGEGRSLGFHGMLKIAWVMKNREQDPQRRWPRKLYDVCMQPSQFSTWLAKSWNLENLHSMVVAFDGDVSFQLAKAAAICADNALFPDPTNGSNFYHEDTMSPFPSWADASKKTVTDGHLIFYKM